LVGTIWDSYQNSTRRDKGRILDGFIAVAGLHSKHSIRLLTQSTDKREHHSLLAGGRIYVETVREAMILVWEISDRICVCQRCRCPAKTSG